MTCLVKILTGLFFVTILNGCWKQAEKSLKSIPRGNIEVLRPKIPLWEPKDSARTQLVVRSPDEWQQAWDKTAKAKGQIAAIVQTGPRALPADFSFDRQMILMVYGGSAGSNSQIQIAAAREDGNTIQVEVVSNLCEGPFTLAMAISIGDAVAINKTEKELIFNYAYTRQCPHPPPKRNMGSSFNWE